MISRIEQGRIVPGAEVIFKLADKLGMTGVLRIRMETLAQTQLGTPTYLEGCD